MSIQNITDDSFDEKVLKNSKPVCLRFTANWCGD
jgi:thioredoxin-like negative regulator of GroEL|tara:strand:+ start:400 stop:501 length:102 start_codon:yes stop_codon:yes gene_type:complete